MKPHGIVIVFREFTHSTDGEARPAVVIRKMDKTLICFRITSKYENKSVAIKGQYYPVQDWTSAGLQMKSWIDVGATATIDLMTISYKQMGNLSFADIKGLKEFIENYYGYTAE